jgi:hypothetical protein
MQVQDTINQIKHHHLHAQSKANEAVAHAKAAGDLLLQVKDSMPHGYFTSWIRKNLPISERTAQRYMAVSLGKSVPVRQLTAKNDKRVSVLKNPEDQGRVVEGKWLPNYGFHYCYATDDASFWVVPSTRLHGFHVSKLYSTERDPNVDPEIYADPDDPNDEREWDGMSHYNGTRHPMPSNMIDGFLRHILEMPDPTTVHWLSFPGEGLERPFGEPES